MVRNNIHVWHISGCFCISHKTRSFYWKCRSNILKFSNIMDTRIDLSDKPCIFDWINVFWVQKIFAVACSTPLKVFRIFESNMNMIRNKKIKFNCYSLLAAKTKSHGKRSTKTKNDSFSLRISEAISLIFQQFWQ